MRVSNKGIIELISHEAIVPMPYLDSVGVWTWGVGHTAAAGTPDPVKMKKGEASSLSQVLSVFKNDLRKYENGVNRVIEVPLEPHQFDALVSFHYNTGAIARASLTDSINRGDFDKAADQFLNWNKPREIIGRRQKEQKLFEDGIYSNDGMVTVYEASRSGRVIWSSAKRIDITEHLDGSVPDTNGHKPIVRAGDTGEYVRLLQSALGIHDDGIFGQQTKAAVIDFQKHNGLKPDGVVGPKTWEKLGQ